MNEMTEETKTRAVRIIVGVGFGGVGICMDGQIIQKILPNSRVVLADNKEEKEIEVDINIHIEHVHGLDGDGKLKDFPGKVNYLLINHEFIYDWDLDCIQKQGVIPLAKTKIGVSTLEKIGIDKDKIIYTGFMTISRPPATKNKGLFIHLAGTSPFKNTQSVINGWMKSLSNHDCTLFVTRTSGMLGGPMGDLWCIEEITKGHKPEYSFMGIKNVYKIGNIYISKEKIDEKQLNMLITAAEYHLVPSAAEGYGHIIHQGRAAGGIVITTNIAPMNEVINDENGILITPDLVNTVKQILKRTKWFIKGENYNPLAYIVVPYKVAKAIDLALMMSEKDKQEMIEKSLASYKHEAESFKQILLSLVK